jgi:predicted ATP-grasp superfamily ATP-dependent carboligase
VTSYVLHQRPELDAPVLVVCLLGWIDAGMGAATAMEALESQAAEIDVATFDADRFIDYRARRPVMKLREGVVEEMLWPEIKLRAGHDRQGNALLMLTGHEPDSAWREFVEASSTLAIELGARLVVGLGAYPFAAPHTRPPRLSMSAASAELAATLPYGRNSVDVPAGIQAALEHGCQERGVPALGLWSQVPHYVANFPYPAASAALLEGLAHTAGLGLDTAPLREAAAAHRRQVDELVAGNTEHLEMVRQLETAYDAEPATDIGPLAPGGNLPSGDELAAELERFLREQGR